MLAAELHLFGNVPILFPESYRSAAIKMPLLAIMVLNKIYQYSLQIGTL